MPVQLIKDPDVYGAIRESRTSHTFLISFIKELGNKVDANLRASGTVICPGQGLANIQVNIVEPGRICDTKDIFVKAGSVEWIIPCIPCSFQSRAVWHLYHT